MRAEDFKGMHDYYARQGVLPTWARLGSLEELDDYAAGRAAFFTDRLKLPPRMFRQARLLEIGPDTGENSLAFARWGAQLTLVEPNAKTWPHIREYYRKFGLDGRLASLEKVTLEEYASQERFDFIDAEGFIYTLRPESVWIEQFSRLLKSDGLFVISYYERSGALLELFLKMVFKAVRELTGLPAREAAWRVFEAKWESIPHTRSFESWVMDVLENPFVRLKFFFQAGELLGRLSEAGFRLYSSWPPYQDGLALGWHKSEPAQELCLRRDQAFLDRSCLSFALGRKAFLCGTGQATASVRLSLSELTVAIDSLIDGLKPGLVKGSGQRLKEIGQALAAEAVLFDSQEERSRCQALIRSLDRIIGLVAHGQAEELIAFCNADQAFIDFWGQPFHFGVFQPVPQP
ncbi:MAG: class I SAM-dependent methyltransferase [Deltaproteobacteria bacterium]|nr:class I SAM-dependent methyltransferase [Deltaproteobacteria bacterium]